ncbi:MAG: hypothetical protein IJC17_03610 [Clostridia bacterium]|nr:hypothetical protein [Clostridia bacterium]
MIKGINRQMIEVHQPDNPYFERALLVVRASAGESEWQQLQQEADAAVRQAGSYSGLRRARLRYRLVCGGWALLGGGFGLMLGLLLAK